MEWKPRWRRTDSCHVATKATDTHDGTRTERWRRPPPLLPLCSTVANDDDRGLRGMFLFSYFSFTLLNDFLQLDYTERKPRWRRTDSRHLTSHSLPTTGQADGCSTARWRTPKMALHMIAPDRRKHDERGRSLLITLYITMSTISAINMLLLLPTVPMRLTYMNLIQPNWTYIGGEDPI